MTAREFWRIIDDCVSDNKADLEYGYAELAERLEEMSAAQIVEFASHMRQALNDAFTWDLWGAAYLIMGGCSDDGFEYFRGWLMAQGSTVFHQAVANPDSLAGYLPTYEGEDLFEDEDILGAPMSAYETKTGSLEGYELAVRPQPEPEGEQWDFEESGELQARLPRLYALFVEGEEGDDEQEEGEEEEW